MIKNFDEVKKQLAELSSVINKYQSEQVQLKIVEFVFRGAVPEQTDEAPDPPQRRGRRRKAKAKVADDKKKVPGAKKSAARGAGPAGTLEQFIQEGFFNQKRTIGAVVDHCKAKARNYKNNELSGPLGRLVRNNKLSRAKNSDGQWEYTKK